MWRKLFIMLGCLFVLAVMLGGVFLFYLTKDLPSMNAFDNRKVAQSSKIYDRTGTVLLYEIHGEEKRTILPFALIPERVKQVTLAIEDVNFYNHAALDYKSIVRAAFANFRQGSTVQGGSTITQQLAKNAFLSAERTLTRKLKELILAVELERRYSKDEILGLYLNQIPYGANSYGIAAAATTYFGKTPDQLTLAEIALLASLPKASSYYSPWGSHKKELFARKDIALDKMFALGFISADENVRAKKQALVFLPQTTNIKAPHFVMEVIDYLNTQYGEAFIQRAGWNITTTLDYNLQQIAERVVLEGAQRNETLYGGKNAALVVQDATTGQILALVGSRDYFDVTLDGNFNVATQGLRQPGSALKPFVYLTAFEKGFTPDTMLFDLETEFDTTDEPENSYKPGNFDEIFRGPVIMKQALAQSLNVPAVKTLYLAGIDQVLKIVKNFGISTLTERSRYGLSLVLGGGEVKLKELVGAYGVLSQDGVRHKQTYLLQINEATTGRIVEEYRDEQARVIDAQYVRQIDNILSDIDLRRGLFHSSLGLTVFEGQEVALKTGTTNDYRDAWALGFTPHYVVGVWAGNNDNTPMERRGTSLLAAVPIWSAFMQEFLLDKPLAVFPQPDPVIVEKPALRGEVVINNQIHDILYYVDKRNPQGPVPERPEEDSQFKNWEDPVIAYAASTSLDVLKQTFHGASDTAPQSLTLEIIDPVAGAFLNNQVSVFVRIHAPQDIKNLEVILNERTFDLAPMLHLQKVEGGYEYRLQVPVALEIQNLLVVRATDAQGTVEKKVVFFR